jgi:molybdate-binding protein
VGLGLRSTATALELGFVPLGRQTVRLLANPDRVDKSAMETLESKVETLDHSQFSGVEPR